MLLKVSSLEAQSHVPHPWNQVDYTHDCFKLKEGKGEGGRTSRNPRDPIMKLQRPTG